jgi:hypothetical protein
LAGPEEVEVDDPGAAQISKLSWSYHWKKRIEADGARLRCKWRKLVRLVAAPG